MPDCCTYTGFSDTYGTPPVTPVVDMLDIGATDIATVTIDPIRAGIDCHAVLNVTTDGPITITIAGCPTTYSYVKSPARNARPVPIKRRQ